MMSDIRINDNAAGTKIMAAVMSTLYHPETDTCIHRERDKHVLGGVVFRNYTHGSIEMHCASFTRNWISRDLLWMCFHWPFTQLNCRKVFAPIKSTNTRMVLLAEHLGFTAETRVKDVYLDGDLVVYSMYSKQCRWLNLEPRKVGPGGSNGR